MGIRLNHIEFKHEIMIGRKCREFFSTFLLAKISTLPCSSHAMFFHTPAPLPNTVIDFWRLVWQEKCPSIVMLTNLVEGGKVKCLQYWPDSDSKNYGPFEVTVTDKQMFADYLIRVFTVKVSTVPK